MNKRAWWLLAVLLAPVSASAALQTIPLPATLNEQDVGELNVVIEDQQLRAVDIGPILPQLQQLLTPARYETLRTNIALSLPSNTLEAVGIQTRFDFQNLKLTLTVPGEARRTQELNLVGGPNFTAGVIVRPSPFSAYMNVRGGVTYTESSQAGTHGFNDPQLDLENVFNIHGLVLENETVVNPAPGKT